MTIDVDKDAATAEPDAAAKTERGESTSAAKVSRSLSVSVSTLTWGAVTAIAVVAALVLGGFLISARGQLSDRDATATDKSHAEQVASDYAVGAATVNFADFNSWVGRLKNNTAPALATKFDSTAPKLQEILTPLKWTSTATPIAAKVMSESGGVYKVDVFVNVTSTNAQNPDGAQTTVTYDVSVDRNAGWKITDVGGAAGALPIK
ncbi:hypothetical protein [Nocardia sp. CDC160]|uniref:hypothetical protein n=1 Tax=Nocardia sp. CDC160 TaxID=3112166 RepID=UPI002DBEA688|nr:hypothetical protein [Nocardia sp. CDC160]MEC3919384.1 hypothetical protein [Nocardia sp. CDC160]